MIKKLKNLEENYEPNIDIANFRAKLPKIKKLFLIEFVIMLIIFCQGQFNLKQTKGDLSYEIELRKISIFIVPEFLKINLEKF